MLGRRIAARQPPPTYLPELRRALLDEWCNIPQDQIDNLILSMPMRSKRRLSRLWEITADTAQLIIFNSLTMEEAEIISTYGRYCTPFRVAFLGGASSGVVHVT
ncbi:transposable element Tcb1 transposase [Trichonephila clavipes]|uniref:Transposable element Tcb1 transposase n=1 Tax=Trichonephila clavipes TaxID=2585209 RepID=A0A8X6WBZ2_TRICX|nr:transposable element Tcb1 transposase [Trichonephila clavipes]